MSGSYKDAMAAGRADLWAGREKTRTALEGPSVGTKAEGRSALKSSPGMSEGEAGGNALKQFPPETTDVQSRYVIVHQLRASADIQDGQTRRETGWATTSDRASLMREAADTIEALAAAPSPVDQEGVREALAELLVNQTPVGTFGYTREASLIAARQVADLALAVMSLRIEGEP